MVNRSTRDVGEATEYHLELSVFAARQHRAGVADEIDLGVSGGSFRGVGRFVGVVLRVRVAVGPCVGFEGAPRPAVGTVRQALTVEVEVDVARIGGRSGEM